MFNGHSAPVISRGGGGLPSRIVLHGVEGIGKSSYAAFAPKPIFLMTRGETGLLTLIDNGLVPPTDHFDEIMDWPDLLRSIDYLIQNPRGNKTVVLDTVNGAERLCFEHIAGIKYQGDWEKFISYGKGPDIAANEFWPELLEKLGRLRQEQKVMLVLLAHSKIKTFKNPLGDDYDRYAAEMHEKTWGHVAKWADIILFGNFDVLAEKGRGELKAKGKSAGGRTMYTTRTAAFDAKNRHGLPERISMGKEPHESWANFVAAIKGARAAGQAQPEPENPPATLPMTTSQEPVAEVDPNQPPF